MAVNEVCLQKPCGLHELLVLLYHRDYLLFSLLQFCQLPTRWLHFNRLEGIGKLKRKHYQKKTIESFSVELSTRGEFQVSRL